MDTFFEALGYLSVISSILAQLKQAEATNQAQVSLPPIYVHHHKITWTINASAVKTTEPPKPKNPTLPGT